MGVVQHPSYQQELILSLLTMALSIANLNVQQNRRNPSRVLLKKSSSLRTTKSTARRLLADVTKSITAVECRTGDEERRVQPLPQVPAGLRDIDVEEEDNPALSPFTSSEGSPR